MIITEVKMKNGLRFNCYKVKVEIEYIGPEKDQWGRDIRQKWYIINFHGTLHYDKNSCEKGIMGVRLRIDENYISVWDLSAHGNLNFFSLSSSNEVDERCDFLYAFLSRNIKRSYEPEFIKWIEKGCKSHYGSHKFILSE